MRRLIKHFIKLYNTMMIHGILEWGDYEFITKKEGKIYINFYRFNKLYRYCMDLMLFPACADNETPNIKKFSSLKKNRNRKELIIIDGFEYLYLLTIDKNYTGKINKSIEFAEYLNQHLKNPMNFDKFNVFIKDMPDLVGKDSINFELKDLSKRKLIFM